MPKLGGILAAVEKVPATALPLLTVFLYDLLPGRAVDTIVISPALLRRVLEAVRVVLEIIVRVRLLPQPWSGAPRVSR